MSTAKGILSDGRDERLARGFRLTDDAGWCFVSTCDHVDGVGGGERDVLPALALPVDHDLHDLCPQGDVGGVDGHAGGRVVALLEVLT